MINSKEKLKRIMSVLGIKSHFFYEAKTQQGLTFKVEGDLAVGAPIYVQTDEGMIPAPDGQHILDDGCTVDVVEGKIAKIQYEDGAPAKTEDTTETTEETMSLEKPEIFLEGDIFLEDGKVLRPSKVPASTNTNVRFVQYDGLLTAVHDGLYTAKNGDVYEVVGAEIKSIRTADQMKELKNQFAEAKSKSGHKVMAPAFAEGETITFEGIEGTEMELPDGEYDLEGVDGSMMYVMVKDGKIESVETKTTEEEETTEEEVGEDMKVPHSPDAPSIHMSEVESLFKKSFAELSAKLETITKKQDELEKRFFKFSNLPAGEPIKNNTPNNKPISSDEAPVNRILENFRRMREQIS